jgi:P27 family predicted phage terminase small subunit
VRKSTLTVINPGKPRPNFKPPATLPRKTRSHYVAICNLLWDGGKFHETDALLVAQYVLAHHEADTARAVYVAEGMTVEGAHGLRAHPMIAVSNQARTTAAKLAATLGLGPTHRHRMAASVEAFTSDADSPWEAAAKVNVNTRSGAA